MSASPPLLKRVKRFARYVLIRALLLPLQLIPLRLASSLGASAGGLAFTFAGRERRKALASLSTAFPEKTEAEREALARATFRHLGSVAMELVRISAFDPRRKEFVEWDEESRTVLKNALARGRGVVFVTGHVGNWELLARFITQEGFQVSVVGKETSDPRTTKLLEDFRLSAGMRVIWRGHEGAAKQLLRTLKSNSILGILIDQDTKVQSVWVPFFGKPAKTPRAAADLVLRTGAAPILGFCTRVGPLKYCITVREVPTPEGRDEAAVEQLTADFTRGIEAQIRAHPEQWVWMHERWKSPRPPLTIRAHETPSSAVS